MCSGKSSHEACWLLAAGQPSRPCLCCPRQYRDSKRENIAFFCSSSPCCRSCPLSPSAARSRRTSAPCWRRSTWRWGVCVCGFFGIPSLVCVVAPSLFECAAALTSAVTGGAAALLLSKKSRAERATAARKWTAPPRLSSVLLPQRIQPRPPRPAPPRPAPPRPAPPRPAPPRPAPPRPAPPRQVKEFYGSMHSHASLGSTTGVIVCTIEKANIL